MTVPDRPRPDPAAPGSILGVALLIGLTVFWGGNWPAMKLGLRELDVWTFRALCLIVGGIGLLALARAGGHPLTVPRAERGRLCVVAFLNITLWHLLSAYGITRIQAGRAAIIAYTMPIWTVLLGWPLLGERLTVARTAALGLGLGAMAILIAPETRGLARTPAGVAFMLGAALAWALGTVLTKGFRWTMPTVLLAGWQILLGAVPVVLGAVILGPRLLAPLTVAGALGTAYAVLVGMIFCHYAWFKVVSLLPSTVAAIGTLGVPMVGVLSSALVLGEPIGLPELLALGLVVAGLTLLIADSAFRDRAR